MVRVLTNHHPVNSVFRFVKKRTGAFEGAAFLFFTSSLLGIKYRRLVI
jgi:hypothetical protein